MAHYLERVAQSASAPPSRLRPAAAPPALMPSPVAARGERRVSDGSPQADDAPEHPGRPALTIERTPAARVAPHASEPAGATATGPQPVSAELQGTPVARPAGSPADEPPRRASHPEASPPGPSSQPAPHVETAQSPPPASPPSATAIAILEESMRVVRVRGMGAVLDGAARQPTVESAPTPAPPVRTFETRTVRSAARFESDPPPEAPRKGRPGDRSDGRPPQAPQPDREPQIQERSTPARPTVQAMQLDAAPRQPHDRGAAALAPPPVPAVRTRPAPASARDGTVTIGRVDVVVQNTSPPAPVPAPAAKRHEDRTVDTRFLGRFLLRR
jgi:hypothetical protein